MNIPGGVGFTQFITQTWIDGGWVMIPLVMLALFIYFESFSLLIHLGKGRVAKIKPAQWLPWIQHPERARGYPGEVIQYVMADGLRHDCVMHRIESVKQGMLPSVNQKILLLGILVTVAPLMGLLGTVIGMLTTFRGLASSTGQTAEMVANGIRVALITTQTGLMIAIPGYIFLSAIIRRRNEHIVFLTQVESAVVKACAQSEQSEPAASKGDPTHE